MTETQYLERAREQYSLYLNTNEPLRAANAGAFFRKGGDVEKAINVLSESALKHPQCPAIHLNLANAYISKKDFEHSLKHLRECIKYDFNNKNAWRSFVFTLRQLNQTKVAFKSLLNSNIWKADIELCATLLELATDISCREDILEFIFEQIEELLPLISPGCDQNYTKRAFQERLMASNMLVNGSKPNQALDYFKSSLEIAQHIPITDKQSFWISNTGWNLSISLLRHGQLSSGWYYYQHGLRVPAEGRQRWQRSLFKPYSTDNVSLWRGEDLTGKSLLVLAEQAIGDTIMFERVMQLVTSSSHHVYFYPGNRLYSLYKRTYKSHPSITILKEAAFTDGSISPEQLDYMIPIGSIPRYYFQDYPNGSYEDVRYHRLMLDDRLTTKIRTRYLSSNKIVVGISWRGGGGKQKRVKQKSLDLESLLPILSDDRFTFISLQYGNVKKEIDEFNAKYGTSIIYDDKINAVSRFDEWMHQCGACDIVVSVANTTVHGAGSIGKPTFVFLSRKADWRWVLPEVSNVQNSYWYSNIDVGYQDDDSSWENAVKEAKNWLAKASSQLIRS